MYVQGLLNASDVIPPGWHILDDVFIKLHSYPVLAFLLLLLVCELQLTITPEDQEQIRQVLAPMNVIPLFAPLEDHKSFGSYCLYVLGPALHNVLETSTRDENEFSLAKLVKGFEAYKKVPQD